MQGRSREVVSGGEGSAQVLVDAAHVHLDLAAAVLDERRPAREEPAELDPVCPVRAVDLAHVDRTAVVVHGGQVDEVAVVHGRAHRT
jgi:hypothetical protein